MKIKHLNVVLFVLTVIFATCIALFAAGCKGHTHTWDSGVVTTEATHIQTGIMTYTCTSCGETKTETIEKTEGHTYSDWQSYSDTQHVKVCECGNEVYDYHTYSDWQSYSDIQHVKECECGHEIYEEHSWDSGVVTTEATHTQTGVMTYTCASCGETKTETIDMVEHVYVNGKCECGAVDENFVPETSYFSGNVFQIVGFDLGGIAIVSGTGFVINESGYFITNAHVMEEAYYAYAVFEIPNKAEGESFTRLEITQAAINNTNKDIFVGVIENYSSISDYYKEIKITDEYEIGDTTYSIGYPNSTPYMEVHKGVIVDKTATFSDKFYGVELIQSTSYVIFGSSGGILINDDLEIIGITARVSLDDEDEFVYSYSISAINFLNYVSDAENYTLYNLTYLLHPENIDYVTFFENISIYDDAVYSIDDDYIVSYTFNFSGTDTNDAGYAYAYKGTLKISSDFSIYYSDEYYWDMGDYRTIFLGGVWSPESGIDDFVFIMRYEYTESEYFIISSSDINYNENVDLTLRNYYVYSSSSYTVTDEDITYAKGIFNNYYEYIIQVLEDNK